VYWDTEGISGQNEMYNKGVSSNCFGLVMANDVGFGSDLVAKCQTFDQQQQPNCDPAWHRETAKTS
jgi:hypothetical protein